MLAETSQLQPVKAPRLIEALETGQAKLYVTYRALQFRRQHKQLFEQGQYLPLSADGPKAENIVAFLRKNGAEFALAVAPRFPVSLLHIGEGGSAESNRSQTIYALNKGGGSASEVGRSSRPLWNPDWLGTSIRLPADVPTEWRDVFTGGEMHSSMGRLLLSEVLGGFPVALLEGGGSG
jgi:(1->4)-alpha-D-glucan 1-alpha-D-glucosylmutase